MERGLEPSALRAQAHAEAPWIEARGATALGERCEAIITKDKMGEYYGER